MAGHRVPGINFMDTFGDLGHGPSVRSSGRKVAADHPDDVGQVPKPLADESSISAKLGWAARLDLTEEAFITAVIAEVGRAQPDDEAAIVGLADHLMGECEVFGVRSREVAGLLKWRRPARVLGANVVNLCSRS